MRLTHEQPRILIRLGAAPLNREDAIRSVGRLLVQAGCVAAGYEESMLRREELGSTYLGEGVAIPHGMRSSAGVVARQTVAVLQVPGGVMWGEGQIATLVFGIAVFAGDPDRILQKVAELCIDIRLLAKMSRTADPAVILSAFTVPGPSRNAACEQDVSGEDLEECIEWTLDYPAGLHVRPAMVWSATAKAAGISMRVRAGTRAADAGSMVALLRLGAVEGERLRISAQGPNAASRLRDFQQVISGLSDGEKRFTENAAQTARMQDSPWRPPGNTQEARCVGGLPVGPGLVAGTVYKLTRSAGKVPDHPGALAEDGRLLEQAIQAVKQELRMQSGVRPNSASHGSGVLDAQVALLEDKELLSLTCRYIASGHGAAWAWNRAVEELAGHIAVLGNAVLAARADDLRDIGHRVLGKLVPDRAEEDTMLSLPEGPVILLADDLSPSEAARLDPGRVVGLVTARGSDASHTAMMVRTLGIAAVAGAVEAYAGAQNGETVIVDGFNGCVWLNPSEEALASAGARVELLSGKPGLGSKNAASPTVTTDATRVALLANVNAPSEVTLALELGAEGVGLLRSEFAFVSESGIASEDEQYEMCRRMAAALDDRPLTIRAVDFGGDKRLPAVERSFEEHPYMGVRGTRLLLKRPDLLEPQLRAVYRAAAYGCNISILFPMVSSVAEVLALRKHCESVRMRLEAPRIPLGIMVEVPSVAVMADIMAGHVEFFSIGTNDLTQFTLAMDRCNPELAARADGLHPAVLRLIHRTIAAASARGRRVGVCGEMAADPASAALFVGLGARELSMPPKAIAPVRAVLGCHSINELGQLARKALDCSDAGQVRRLVADLVMDQKPWPVTLHLPHGPETSTGL